MAQRLRPAAAFVLILAVPLLLAMGMGDSEGPTSIPEPQANYRVRLTDLEGVTIELTNFSIDGQVFVLGKLGEGQMAVPLEKVRAVELTKEGDRMKAHLILDQDKPLDLMVNPALKVYGKTEYGNFRIPLGQLTRIEVLGLIK